MNGTVVEQWGGHYSDGFSSDKVWAGAYTDQGEFLVAYGRRPNAVNAGAKTFGSAAAARDHFRHKVAEKRTKGYSEVPFDDPHYGLRSFGAVVTGPAPAALQPRGVTARDGRKLDAARQPSPAIHAARVYAIDADALDRARLDPNQAISEKLNGMRLLLEHDGKGTMTAYNRRAVPVPRALLCAERLRALGGAFTLDGELLADDQGERYIAFDVLQLDGQDLRQTPYVERIDRLRQRLRENSVVAAGVSAIG